MPECPQAGSHTGTQAGTQQRGSRHTHLSFSMSWRLLESPTVLLLLPWPGLLGEPRSTFRPAAPIHVRRKNPSTVSSLRWCLVYGVDSDGSNPRTTAQRMVMSARPYDACMPLNKLDAARCARIYVYCCKQAQLGADNTTPHSCARGSI